MRGTIGTCRKCGQTVERSGQTDWVWYHSRDLTQICDGAEW